MAGPGETRQAGAYRRQAPIRTRLGGDGRSSGRIRRTLRSGSRPMNRSAASWNTSARSRCRPIFIALRMFTIANVTRQSSPRNKGPRQLRQQDCISLRRCSTRCSAAGAAIAYVTLHVGLGNVCAFARAKSFHKSNSTKSISRFLRKMREMMRAAQRLVCVGTTSVRTLETAMLRGGLQPMSGETNLFIYPGLSLPRDRSDADQLPPAAIKSADVSVRLWRKRPGHGRLPSRRPGTIPLLFLRRLHVGALSVTLFRRLVRALSLLLPG